MHYLLTLLLGPILLYQGYRVKKQTPRLPEPPGSREGVSGNGPELKLLILGDSAGAGVGAKHQDEALSGQLVWHLSQNYSVHWKLYAATGATTKSTLASVFELSEQSFDVVITSLGVNDVTSGMALSLWRRQQQQLREYLRKQLKIEHIICTGLPPMHRFPALTQPLRWYLGRRAVEFDRDLQAQLKHEKSSHYLKIQMTGDNDLMASDGFHPGPAIYREWGKVAADLLVHLLAKLK